MKCNSLILRIVAGLYWLGLCLPWLASAAINEEIQSLSVTNFTGYVIDSDGNFPSEVYNRDTIRVAAKVRYSTLLNTVETIDYQLQFRLLDSNNNAVTLSVNGGQTAKVVVTSATITLPQMVLGITVKNSTRNYGVALKPAVRLDPNLQYHVELTLYERPGGSNARFSPTGVSETTPAQTYYHFRNTESGDPARNVIGTVDGVGFSRSYAVKTIPAKNSFLVPVDYQLRRYDDFYTVAANTSVALHFNAELVEAISQTVIPLVKSNTVINRSIASYVLGAPYKPAVLSLTDILDLEPAAGVQLDSVNHTYVARVTLLHVDVSGQDPLLDDQAASLAQRLLHFNGNLIFNNIPTTFSSIDNNPAAGVVVPNSHVTTQLGVDGNSGKIVGHPSHTYGNGTDLSVKLLPNGDAKYTGADVVVNQPAPDNDEAADIRFERKNLLLNSSGARSGIVMTLPTGFGYRNDLTGRRLDSKISWANVPLNPALVPSNDLTYSAALFACEETKPFWIGASSLQWQVAIGRLQLTPTSIHYVRRFELDELEAAPGLFEPDMKLKRSNEQYHRWVEQITSSRVLVKTDGQGNARLSLDLSFSPGEFVAHFPYDARVKWLGDGAMRIIDDQISPTNSYLSAVNTVTNRYNQDCPGCGVGKGLADLRFNPSEESLLFTPDGGLHAAGALAQARPLNWGWISAPAIQKYAQRTTEFSAGNFLMAGCFLRGDQTALELKHRPGVILLSGALPSDLAQTERPGTPPYLNGFADYAGLNFRTLADGAIQAESVLAGKPSGLYQLTGRSKYYTRHSGVSGIHEAVPGTFPSQLKLYGYDFTFDNYGLSYLSSQNEDSRTEGHVHIVAPSNFDQNFEELKLSCVGALESAKVPADEAGLYKLLEYWNADFITLGIKFDRDDSVACDPAVGYLVLGVQGHATYVPEPLFGALGFKSNGNLISAKDVTSGEIKLDPGFNSRLKIANNFKVQGPEQEQYNLNPVTDAYFNDWESRDPGFSQGFVNLAADMDVPFFENLKGHLHTSGKTNSPFAPIYVMGGWPNQGYGTAANNFFTNPNFDEDNSGYPTLDGLTKYRDNPEEKYHPRAQTSWLGVIDLDYPLEWLSTVRWFKSWKPVRTDVLVLSTEHKVKYLSAQNVDLAFGTRLDVSPNLSPTTVFNFIDGQFGIIEAFQEAGMSSNHMALKAGFAAMDTLLATDPHRFYDLPALADSYVLAHIFAETVVSNPGIVDFQIDEFFDPQNGSLIGRLRQLDVGEFGLIDNMRDNLDDAMAAVDSLRSIIRKEGTNRVAASVLLGQVLRKGDVKFAEFVVNELGGLIGLNRRLDTYLDQYDSSFNTLDDILKGVKAQLYSVRTNLNDGGQFYTEIHELVVQHDATLQNVVAKVRDDVKKYFAGIDPVDELYDIGINEIYLVAKQSLGDRFCASPLASAIQVAAKQRVYDLDAAVREAADTEFAMLAAGLRDATDDLLALVDKVYNKLLGKLQQVGAVAEIKGHAHINGDSLKLLRLDAKAQIRLPDAMEFAGYFQIKELDSDGTPTECLPASGRATEVTMGAIDIPVSYSGSTNDALKVTVETKFTFDPGPTNAPLPVPLLITLGGKFELKGKLEFGSLIVEYLSAGAAFGELENYITAAATVKQGGYKGSGGVFIGRTCTLGFLYWDKDVSTVLGNQLPFTGAYFYGEAWVPMAEVILGIPSTCMFDISAGAGAGFGVFAEGPTFVAKMLFGLSGEFGCIARIKGTVALAGKANPDGLTLAGRGTLEAALGPLEGEFDIFMTYNNFVWDVDL